MQDTATESRAAQIVYGSGTKYKGRVTVHLVRCTECNPVPGTWFEDDKGGPREFSSKRSARAFGTHHMQDEHGLVPAGVGKTTKTDGQGRQHVVDSPWPDNPNKQSYINDGGTEMTDAHSGRFPFAGGQAPQKAVEDVTEPHSGQSEASSDDLERHIRQEDTAHGQPPLIKGGNNLAAASAHNRDIERAQLNRKGIEDLRKMSRGKFSGGYSMKKAELIEALIDHNAG